MDFNYDPRVRRTPYGGFQVYIYKYHKKKSELYKIIEGPDYINLMLATREVVKELNGR